MRQSVDEYPTKTLSVVKQKDEKNVGLEYKTVDVLGIPVGAFTRAELTAFFLEILKSQKRGWISYVNVHTINLACSLDWFKQYLRDSIFTYCDGHGVRIGAALLGKRLTERIVFTDWIYDVCKVADQTGTGVYFLGANDIVLDKARTNLLNIFPSLKIAGMHHGYFTNQDTLSIVDLINRSGADILIVGMGMPKQEKWIQEQFAQLRPRLVLNAGSCLDFVAGSKRRCPSWLGKIGFEWLFRFILEPRRLWRRYLMGILYLFYAFLTHDYLSNEMKYFL
jgi:N-acetylglucosaminyldiphosphoundecaprenol N-acetyl-beta-D-mannosaminyltransferase